MIVEHSSIVLKCSANKDTNQCIYGFYLLQVQSHWGVFHQVSNGNGIPYNFPFIPSVALPLTQATTTPQTPAPPIDPRIDAMLNTPFGLIGR